MEELNIDPPGMPPPRPSTSSPRPQKARRAQASARPAAAATRTEGARRQQPQPRARPIRSNLAPPGHPLTAEWQALQAFPIDQLGQRRLNTVKHIPFRHRPRMRAIVQFALDIATASPTEQARSLGLKLFFLLPSMLLENRSDLPNLPGRLNWFNEGRWRALLHSRSEEHTYELQSLMRISYAVFCLKKKQN